jgi:hypothetical protein
MYGVISRLTGKHLVRVFYINLCEICFWPVSRFFVFIKICKKQYMQARSFFLCVFFYINLCEICFWPVSRFFYTFYQTLFFIKHKKLLKFMFLYQNHVLCVIYSKNTLFLYRVFIYLYKCLYILYRYLYTYFSVIYSKNTLF